MSNPYFSQYESPNIVIVPTVSFCEPPKRRPILETPISNHVTTPVSNYVTTPINISSEENKEEQIVSEKYLCAENQENQCNVSNYMRFQENQCSNYIYGYSSMSHIVTTSNTNSTIPASAENQVHNNLDTMNEDITKFSKAECDKMVKKTLSWASNYLRSIGQSHPNTSKQYIPPFQPPQKPDDGIIQTLVEDKQVIDTSYISYENNNNLQPNFNVVNVNNKLSTETSKSQETYSHNETKPIQLNLLYNKMPSQYCKSDNYHTNSIDEYSYYVKDINNQNSSSKYIKPDNISRSGKKHIRNPSNVKTSLKHREDTNSKKTSYVTKKTKHEPRKQDKITSKRYLDARKSVSRSSIYDEKINKANYPIKISQKIPEEHINRLLRDTKNEGKDKDIPKKIKPKPKNFIEKVDNLKKPTIDTPKQSQKSDETDVKCNEGKNTTPIKSVVKITENFDLNGPSLYKTELVKEDLRNKLKRKYQTYHDYELNSNQAHVAKKDNGDKQTTTISEGTRKFKKIKLVIELVCEKYSESSESESDAKSNEYSLANVDLSFLDDFNVDDIVESLNLPEAKNLVDSKVHESFKPRDELMVKKIKTDTLADTNNNEHKETEHTMRLQKSSHEYVQIAPNDDDFKNSTETRCETEKNEVIKDGENDFFVTTKIILNPVKQEANTDSKTDIPIVNDNTVISLNNDNMKDSKVHIVPKVKVEEYAAELDVKCHDLNKEEKCGNKNTGSNNNIQCYKFSAIHEIETIAFSESEDEELLKSNNIASNTFGAKSSQSEITIIDIDNMSDKPGQKNDFKSEPLDNTDIISELPTAGSNINGSKDKQALTDANVKITTLHCSKMQYSINKDLATHGLASPSPLNINTDTVNTIEGKNTVFTQEIQDNSQSYMDNSNRISMDKDLAKDEFASSPTSNINTDKVTIIDDKHATITQEIKDNDQSNTSNRKSIEENFAKTDCAGPSPTLKEKEIICDEKNNIITQEIKDNGQLNTDTSNRRLEIKEFKHDTHDSKNKYDNNLINENNQIKLNQENKTKPEDKIGNKNKLEKTKKGTPKISNIDKIPPENVSCLDFPDIKALSHTLNSQMHQYFGEKISITNFIHEGQFSKIFECKDARGHVYALKVMQKKQELGKSKMLMLNTLQKDVPKNNYHCIYLHDAFGRKEHWCFLMEYYPMNLQEVLTIKGKSFHINEVQKLARQLISAMVLLRNNNIAHLGIKPEHILLNTTNNRLKLAGFDEARNLYNINVYPNLGTVNYRPPEVILGYNYMVNIDVWSTALIMYEMATCRQLFAAIHNNDMLFKQQCMFGNIPFNMLELSAFKDRHFHGNYFIRNVSHNKVMIRQFNATHNKLRSYTLSTYHRDWGKLRSHTDKRDDIRKLHLFINLLLEMLTLHPRDRLPIEYAYTNSFIYDSFTSDL